MESVPSSRREVWVDWMRITACFMVFVVHSTEPFYLGGEGSLILTKADMFWASFFDSFVRACVPLFVVASSYLQFPIHYTAGEFLRRRVVRVLIPFAVWTVVYALIWGSPVQNFKDLVFNFNYSAGHMWFVYMLAGLYLLMPLLSPWAEKVSRKELTVYLCICLFTTLIPTIREIGSAGAVSVEYGVGGLPMQWKFPIWGEASWNAYGTLYYFSGFLGYMLLGLYLRRFPPRWSAFKNAVIAALCWLGGFAICFTGFIRRVMQDCGGVFPVEGKVAYAVHWETTWCNDCIGVALMTIGWILLFRRISCQGGFYLKVVLPVSKASYGMYLCHMIALVAYSGLWRGLFGTGAGSSLGIMTQPVEILLTAVCTYVTVAAISIAGQKIPVAGKYIFG